MVLCKGRAASEIVMRRWRAWVPVSVREIMAARCEVRRAHIYTAVLGGFVLSLLVSRLSTSKYLSIASI